MVQWNMNVARLFKNPKSETNYSWPIGHPRLRAETCTSVCRHEPQKLRSIILPLDGGGLRWGWTKYIPPYPHPLPPRGAGDTGRGFGFNFSFARNDYV